MKRRKKFWLAVLFVIAMVAAFIYFFQWLWNTLLPEIIGVKAISYWQAFGILVLSKIIFGGFGGRHKFQPKNPKHEMWKRSLETRFCSSEEERQKLKAMWKERTEAKFYKLKNEN